MDNWELNRLALSVVVMGLTSSIGQVLMVREFMTILYGNELVLGIIFAGWLLGVAIGSWAYGRLAERLRGRVDLFALVLTLSSLVLPMQVLFTRSMAVWLVPMRGEMVGLQQTLYATLLALLPFCSVYGFQFASAFELYSGGDSSRMVSRIYFLEAVGSVLGGLLFTFILVQHPHVLEVIFGLSLLNASVALLLMRGRIRLDAPRRFFAFFLVLLIAVEVFVVAGGGLKRLDANAYQWRWGGFELIHHENSIYGNIAITRSGRQIDFWVNSLPLFTAPDPDLAFVEDIVHFPMLQHESPRRALLIGEGLGGVLRDILKHPVEKVSYVEIDPKIIELASTYSEEASEVLRDPRVKVIMSDGRHYVKRAEGLFDVIIVNLPSPSTLQLNRFYTVEFFREAYEILDEDGVFSTVVSSSWTYVAEEMGNRNRCIYDALNAVFPASLVVPGDYNIFIASKSVQSELVSDAGILAQRLADREIDTRLFSEDYIRYKLSPTRMEISLVYLQRGLSDINQDARPLAVFWDLALWSAMFLPAMRGVFDLLHEVDLWWSLIPLGLSISVLALRRGRLPRRKLTVYLTTFTAGLAGMMFNIVVIYAFQSLCGYLYQELGLLTASFMLGLASGGWVAGHRRLGEDDGYRTLAKYQGIIIAYSAILAVAITFFSISDMKTIAITGARLVLPVLNFSSGFLVGSIFPLACRTRQESGDLAGRAAGGLYASDLLGAFIGSLMSSLWLVPMQGIQGACLSAAALNAASLVLLLGTSRTN